MNEHTQWKSRKQEIKKRNKQERERGRQGEYYRHIRKSRQTDRQKESLETKTIETSETHSTYDETEGERTERRVHQTIVEVEVISQVSRLVSTGEIAPFVVRIPLNALTTVELPCTLAHVHTAAAIHLNESTLLQSLYIVRERRNHLGSIAH
jgi:hypothetical protein